MKHGSLFSGIGGFDLAAEWAGWENIFHCEWNSFGRKVLHHYWPNSISYEDITKTDFTIHRGTIDIITGGFPCQPYSAAGKRLGKEDERHLWPEMLRVIREVQPKWVVGENVLGLVNWSGGLVFEEVQADLESEGYEVQPYVLPAAGVNAPHRRDRVWFVAYANERNYRRITREDERTCGEERISERDKVRQFAQSGKVQRNATDSDDTRQQTQSIQKSELGKPSESKALSGNRIKSIHRRLWWDSFPTQSPIRSRNDGIFPELDGITVSKHRNESIKAYGNAIVPQVVYQIFKAINEYQTKTT